MRAASLLVALIAAWQATADPHPLALRGLATLDAFDNAQWSYTRTTRDEDGTRIERHDATKPAGARWTLVSVNGKAPTAKAQESFRREKAALEKRDRGDDSDVDAASIRLVSETPQRVTFSFRPKAGAGLEGKMARHVAGTLVVNRQGGWAERFELQSTDALAPVPGVKISAFRLTMTFQRLGATEDVVPLSIELSMRGRAFLVKSLDQERSTRYSDFVRVR